MVEEGSSGPTETGFLPLQEYYNNTNEYNKDIR